MSPPVLAESETLSSSPGSPVILLNTEPGLGFLCLTLLRGLRAAAGQDTPGRLTPGQGEGHGELDPLFLRLAEGDC